MSDHDFTERPVEATADNVERSRSMEVCRYALRGKCKRGDKCKFSHEKARELKQEKQEKQEKQTTLVEVVLTTKEAAERVATPAAVAHYKAMQGAEPPVEPVGTKKICRPRQTKKKKGVKASYDLKDSKDSHEMKHAATQLKTNEKRKELQAQKPTRQSCKFFAKGACRNGERCRFAHGHKSTAAETELKPKKKVAFAIAVIGVPVPSTKPTTTTPNEVVSAAESPPRPAPTVPSAEDWTAHQQRALDRALKKYPVTIEKRDRWVAIASEVEDKTLNDCIDRFKLLSQLVKTGASIPIVPTAAQPPPPPVSDEALDTKETPVDQAGITKIIPLDKRVSIGMEPAVNGAQIRLEELFLYQIGTVIPHSIVCQVQCTHCPHSFDATLTLDNATRQQWCPRCSAKHVVGLQPMFTHAQSNVLAYVDTESCAVVDILPSDLLASCLDCGKEALLEKIVPGRRSEQSCFSCHTKLALMTKRIAVGNASSGDGLPAPTSTSGSSAGSRAKRIVDTFVLGQPLPNNGVCDHFKHSQRWFRFQCCGKAFPCNVCHDSSDCEQANTGKRASKIICGLCSKEQASSVKKCACGNEMGRQGSHTRYWEGGQGCRDVTRMSANDRHKFRGKNKTESQQYKRVGVVGKITRMMTTSAEKRSS